MKLPADRSERIKIFAMMGLFAAGILYVLVNFLLLPHFANYRVSRARLDELEKLLWQAERDIQQTQRNRNRNTEMIQSILHISETQQSVLRPSLGNYLLVAESILSRVAAEAGVAIGAIRETSGAPPQTDPARARQTPAFWPYTVNLNMQVGLHDLTRFVHLLQNQNPYLAVINLAITAGQPSNPTQHNVTMTIQWPVWLDPDHPSRLAAELLADEEQR